MASVTYDGQSFSIDSRRVWMLGASIEYARTPPEVWADRIAAAAQAGFNTIATACPWLVHEPRKGRFNFQGAADVRRFIELCGQAGMWVMLRPGPFIGAHYDAGGLPSWLLETPGIALREANEQFLERVGLYIRKLMGEVADLQVTTGGPILLVQSEHAWRCSNQVQADRYLREVTRYLRENGIHVPITNSNDLWQESPGTIDTWRGRDDLLVHLRQLRVVQPDAPRVVSEFSPATVEVWGDSGDDAMPPRVVVQWLAQILAAGAQPVVWPFHAGTNFGFLGGRRAGSPDGFVTTAGASAAPLSETGDRGATYNAMRRLVSFASSFSHVLADLEPDFHPVTLDVGDLDPAAKGAGNARRLSVVHLRGGGGHLAFVFADGPRQEATLLMDQGIRLPVALGDQPVAWYLADVDLRGSGRLDYANLCPFAMIGRSLLVLQGPARSPAYLSIDGSPIEATVPTGRKPAVLKHNRVTVVICNQEQIDAAYRDADNLYVGIAGLDLEGKPLPAGGGRAAWSVTAEGEPQRLSFETARPGGSTAISLGEWEAASATAYTTGDSPRFATLEGPETLASCGAAQGYGWYRIQVKPTSARKRRWHLPESADRVHLYLDGKLLRIVGAGRGADHSCFDQHLGKGEHVIVALVDNLGHFSEGNDLGERKGLYGHIYDVKRLAAVKPKKIDGAAVDPFELRGYIAGRTRGQPSDTSQVSWTFSHTRKTPILLEIDGAAASGTVVLNDQPIAYYAGSSGARLARILLQPGEMDAFRRGRNVIRFAPDLRQEGAVDEAAGAVTLYECVDRISDPASWAFAKWEPPAATAYGPVSKTAATRTLRGAPCWWRSYFEVRDTPLPLRFDTNGLSKGQVLVNGHNLGRYFTATADGRAVGPQRHMYVPRSWVTIDERNELLVFDEHGFAPLKTKLFFGHAEAK